MAACGQKSTGPADLPPLPAEVDAMPADPGAPVLVDPGAEPRAALRYQHEVGQTLALDLEVSSTITLPSGVSTLPTFVVGARLEVMSVEREVVTARVTHDRGEVRTDDPMAASAEQARGALDAIEGVVASSTLTVRGRPLGSEPVSTTSKVGRGAVAAIGDLATLGLVRLPDEPVGPGARWRTVLNGLPGLRFTAPLELTLASVDGTRIHVTGAISLDEDAAGGHVAGTGALDLAIDLRTLAGTQAITFEVDVTDAAGTATHGSQVVRLTATAR